MSKIRYTPLPSQDDLAEWMVLDPSSPSGLTWRKRRYSAPEGSAVGNRDAYGYFETSFKGRRYKAHRLIWRLATGEDPGIFDIDHINGDRSDNRIENLRVVTRAENLRNANHYHERAREEGRYVGVQPNRGRTRWYASISVNDEVIALGAYDTAEDAARARDAAAREYHGEFARLNFPNPS